MARVASLPKKPDRRSGIARDHLRVCLATAAPFLGGAEIACERLAIGLRDAGHEVLVITGRTGIVTDRLLLNNLDVCTAAMPMTDKWHWLSYLRSRNKLRRILRQFNPDVIHSNDLPTHQILSDAANGLGVPRICHHRFPFGLAALDWMMKYGGERHLYVSNALRRELSRNSAGLREAPGAVVYDGLQLTPLASIEQRLKMRQQLAVPLDRVVVTFAGQVIERKGVADLLQAWVILPTRSREKAMLIIVGEDLDGRGSYRREMERLATSLDCAARFVGFQSDVSTWLTASDVAVVPSHVEPLGNATLEAMAHALPVIGAKVGGIPEMVLEKVTGYLVPPREPKSLSRAIQALITSKDARVRMGEAGRQCCESTFSLEKHTQVVVDEYRNSFRELNCGGVRT